MRLRYLVILRTFTRESDATKLYHGDVIPLQSGIVVDRNPTTGELLGFKEVLLFSFDPEFGVH